MQAAAEREKILQSMKPHFFFDQRQREDDTNDSINYVCHDILAFTYLRHRNLKENQSYSIAGRSLRLDVHSFFFSFFFLNAPMRSADRLIEELTSDEKGGG